MSTPRGISDYSREFSAHLRDFMGERGITHERVAAGLGRTRSYVTEHVNGTRSPDTDLLEVVARLAHLSPRALALEITSRMIAQPV